jgi:hypothetical protein
MGARSLHRHRSFVHATSAIGIVRGDAMVRLCAPKPPNKMKPILRHIANLWTLMEHPWSLDGKLRAFKDSGFDGVCWAGSPELRDGCAKHGLIFVGGMASGNAADFPRVLQE